MYMFYRVTSGGSRMLRWLKAQIGVASQNEVIDTAITLLEWAVEQARNGRQIGSFDPVKKTYRAISMSELEHVRREQRTMAASQHQAAALSSVASR